MCTWGNSISRPKDPTKMVRKGDSNIGFLGFVI
jgi:hypothetical protein